MRSDLHWRKRRDDDGRHEYVCDAYVHADITRGEYGSYDVSTFDDTNNFRTLREAKAWAEAQVQREQRSEPTR